MVVTTFVCLTKRLKAPRKSVILKTPMMDDVACVMCDDSVIECAICYGPLTNGNGAHRLECGHVFHADCAITWFRSGSGTGNKTCPLCRALPLVEMRPVDVMHRARLLITKHKNGGEAVRTRLPEFSDTVAHVDYLEERMQQIQSRRTEYNRTVHATQLKRKAEVLKEYRQLRDEFRARTAPMLKELDVIDDADAKHKRRFKREMAELKRKRRLAMRDIGLWN